MDTSERSMRMRIASYKSWANTRDRSARTEKARKASHYTRFIEQARAKHPDASDEEIAQVAESLRSAHYTELALRSAEARRVRSELKKAEQRKRIAAELRKAGASDAA
jgi:predicted negative regulator of RcsB-dependent stress response